MCAAYLAFVNVLCRLVCDIQCVVCRYTVDGLTLFAFELLHVCQKTMQGSDFSDLYVCEMTSGNIVVG